MEEQVKHKAHGFVAKTSWWDNIKHFSFHSFFGRFPQARLITLLGILLVILVLPVTVIVLQQRTQTQQHAMMTGGDGGGSLCSVGSEVPSSETCNGTTNTTHTLYYRVYTTTTCSVSGLKVKAYNSTTCGYKPPAPPSCSNGKESGTCYTNNSCGGGMHEIDPTTKRCSSPYRICCVKGAPTPWYDCKVNGASGGQIQKHTSTSVAVVTSCPSSLACQDPSTGLVFIKDGSTALSQARSALCKTPTFSSSTVRTCLIGKVCGTGGSVMLHLVLNYNQWLPGACRTVYGIAFGNIPVIGSGIVDAICQNGSNLVKIVTLVPAITAETACQRDINAAVNAGDLATKLIGEAGNFCNIQINSSAIPAVAGPVLGSVIPALRAGGQSICKALFPNIVASKLQEALATCVPNTKISIPPPPNESDVNNKAAGEAKQTIPSCSSVKGTCSTSSTCATGSHIALATCSSGGSFCCAPNTSSGGCTGSNCGGGGGGGSCTNGKSTSFATEMKLPGIGPGTFENHSPKHTTRQTTVTVKDTSGKTIWTQPAFSTKLSFTSAKKLRVGTIGLGTGLACNNTYTVYVKVPGYVTMKKQITYGSTSQTLQVSESDIIPGDLVSEGTNNVVTPDGKLAGDDKVTLADYNVIRTCHDVDPNTTIAFKNGTQTLNLKCGDLMNLFDYPDGGTKGDEWAFNYNLWLRGYLKYQGL